MCLYVCACLCVFVYSVGLSDIRAHKHFQFDRQGSIVETTDLCLDEIWFSLSVSKKAVVSQRQRGLSAQTECMCVSECVRVYIFVGCSRG